MKTWHFWEDEGEELSFDDLNEPDLELFDDSMNHVGMAGWAADELDIDSHCVTFIVTEKGSDVYRRITLVRGGWNCLEDIGCTIDELTGNC